MCGNSRQYCRAVMEKISYGFPARWTLFRRLKAAIRRFEQDYPLPTWRELTDAFGTPEAMAEEMTRGVSGGVRAQWRQQKKLLRWAAVVALVGLLVFAVYALLFKDFTRYRLEEVDGVPTYVEVGD